jgi:hypothetical protein
MYLQKANLIRRSELLALKIPMHSLWTPVLSQISFQPKVKGNSGRFTVVLLLPFMCEMIVEFDFRGTALIS